MDTTPISKKQLNQYLSIPNLINSTDNHAVKLLYEEIIAYMEKTHQNSQLKIYHRNPLVTVEDNYDNLLIPKDNISRSSTYTHYVDKEHVLATHSSAHIPKILSELAQDSKWEDVVVLAPSLVYRRDITDKTHLGVTHQMDVWRIKKGGEQITKVDLLEVIEGLGKVVNSAWKLRIVDMPHPYTNSGVEVNLTYKDKDIEILETGLIKEQILENASLNSDIYSGWAMGMGLDRLVMIKKGIPDIRYLRSDNPQIKAQMYDLDRYEEVSDQPSIKRDMSYCVPDDYVEEDINEDIRNALGEQVAVLESIKVVEEIKYEDLEKVAKERLGCSKNQKNVLVRITLRHLDKTLTKDEANKIYSEVYDQVNYGEKGYNL